MEVLRVTGVMGVLIFLFLAAWMDARTTRIPNGLLLAGILFVLFFVGMMEQNSGLPETVVGCAATGEAHPAYVYFVRQRLLGLVGVSGLLLCLTLFRPGAFGGGDVKLTALTGFFAGMETELVCICRQYIFCGGVCAVEAAAKRSGQKQPDPVRAVSLPGNGRGIGISLSLKKEDISKP